MLLRALKLKQPATCIYGLHTVAKMDGFMLSVGLLRVAWHLCSSLWFPGPSSEVCCSTLLAPNVASLPHDPPHSFARDGFARLAVSSLPLLKWRLRLQIVTTDVILSSDPMQRTIEVMLS